MLVKPAFSQPKGMDIVELDFDTGFYGLLYHYEPGFSEHYGLMGQIFGSPEFDELGYTVGLYRESKSFLIELPVGLLFDVNIPTEVKAIKTKLNWFLALPEFGENSVIEINSINDFGWGVRGFPSVHYNQLEAFYKPAWDFGIRLQSFNVGYEPFAPLLGVIKRVSFGDFQFVLYQAVNLRDQKMALQLNVYYFKFR